MPFFTQTDTSPGVRKSKVCPAGSFMIAVQTGDGFFEGG